MKSKSDTCSTSAKCKTIIRILFDFIPPARNALASGIREKSILISARQCNKLPVPTPKAIQFLGSTQKSDKRNRFSLYNTPTSEDFHSVSSNAKFFPDFMFPEQVHGLFLQFLSFPAIKKIHCSLKNTPGIVAIFVGMNLV